MTEYQAKTAVLCILDGWGVKQGVKGDALSAAKLPNFDKLMNDFPHAELQASGMAVGLPKGQMGNSEVGHLNIGAGRVIYQDLTRISKAITDGEFEQNETLQAAIQPGGRVHMFGLLSDGGVHSEFEHLKALLQMAKSRGAAEVFVHCFMDGRDVSPTSGLGYLKELQETLDELGMGKVATVMGRFYAMDRDKRWERVERAWRAMVLGEGAQTTDFLAAVEKSYADGVTDEFIEPMVVTADGEPVVKITDGDSLIFFNFRADRARELTRAFFEENFEGFARPVWPQVHYTCMTVYDESFPLPVAFGKEHYKNTLGEYLASVGKKQFRVAETEKYAHVTFFFNGGVEDPNPDETRVLVPSPKVQTYDLQPEMSAEPVCDELVKAIESGEYDFVLVNFANPDMVGHTGIIPAAITAVEKVDECLGRLRAAVEKVGAALVVTADHGNAECLLDEAEKPVTAHTTNPVPVIVANTPYAEVKNGALKDLAPTILKLMGIAQPAEMTGEPLI